MMKKIYSILILLLILPLAACSKNGTDLYHQVAPSVVRILAPTTNATGTGFFIAENLIVTNQHVVVGNSYVKIKIHNNNQLYQAQVIGSVDLDLAVLKITPQDWDQLVKSQGVPPALRWRTHTVPEPGEQIWSLGNPIGLNMILTNGVINKSYQYMPDLGLVLITDATVLQGNSGGPLVDSQGRVVGISTAIFNGSENGIGNTFTAAIPAIIAQRAVDQILDKQSVTVNQICVELNLTTNDQYLRLGAVYINGPAWKAGIAPGDKLIAYQLDQFGPKVDLYDVNDVLWMLYSTPPESRIRIQVERNNYRKWISVQSIIRELDTNHMTETAEVDPFGWLFDSDLAQAKVKQKNSCHIHN